MSAEPSPVYDAPGQQTKLLLVTAADALLIVLADDELSPAERSAALVTSGVLPACFQSRYDHDFFSWFHNVVETVRNSLVGDLPHLGSTAEQLAGRALFDQAGDMLAAPDTLERAIGRPADATRLQAELDLLHDFVMEDVEFERLFVLAEEEVEQGAGSPFLSFEHWLMPFGNPPRPAILPDGRAWPAYSTLAEK